MHVCLQSGSENTLKRMHRFYTANQFRDMCTRIKQFRPDFNLTTDIIVGFPGETEAEFAESCDFAKEIGFSHIHTFKYSVRSGTKAATLPDQIPEKVKTQRSETMRGISLQNRIAYFNRMKGSKQRLLVERIDSHGMAKGYGENYIPLLLKANGIQRNRFVEVCLKETINADNEEKMAFLCSII